jgi:hypothetical protein
VTSLESALAPHVSAAGLSFPLESHLVWAGA